MDSGIWRYLRRDKRAVSGWLQRIDAEILGTILQFQEREDIRGACVEIGVHEGKSFVPLCMALRAGELALCIDLFEDQSLNLDASGKGNRNALMGNLRKFGIDDSRIRVFKGSSEAVSAEYILGEVGKVRFFSVDGGHWKDIVVNDMRLAENTLAPGGVIALDDYCRAAWPDVTYGYAVWQEQTASGIVPFAAGSNKLYLCHRDFAQAYRAALMTPFLSMYLAKQYRSHNTDYDCYRQEQVDQDEERFSRMVNFNLRVFYPNLFSALWKAFRR